MTCQHMTCPLTCYAARVKRTETVQIRLTIEEKAALQRAAEERHMDVAEYVRAVAIPSAKTRA